MMALLLDTCCWDGMPNYPSVCTRLVWESVCVSCRPLWISPVVLMTRKCWLFATSPWAARSSVLWCTKGLCLLDALKTHESYRWRLNIPVWWRYEYQQFQRVSMHSLTAILSSSEQLVVWEWLILPLLDTICIKTMITCFSKPSLHILLI